MNEFRSIGVVRHRLATDGDGVTTLAGGHGCPLECRYCLNPQCHGGKFKVYTLESLYEFVRGDSLYFEATGGGITFGGGEPLLQTEFICDFIKFVCGYGHIWKFYIETSLAVEFGNPGMLDELSQLADKFIIDVKDLNPDVYFAYTRKNPEPMMENLRRLSKIRPEKLRVRLPLIPGFNTYQDVESSAALLSKLGIESIDRFTYNKDIGISKLRTD